MVTSRAAQFAARFMEVGWLAALLVVPVFFNVWSDRVFEPDKLSLLRSIGLLVVAAGIMWLIERGRPEPGAWRRWLRTPLVLPVLLLSAAYLLSSLLSVDPRASWLGGHNRLQGTYTWFAYVLLFLAVVALLRDRLQLDRLLFAVVLPSLPVSLYGLLQKLSTSAECPLDPMPWLGDTSKRVASTMGNSIFVSAYLILTVPITLVLLTRAMRDLDDDESNTAVVRVSAYMVMLVMQVMTIVLSQSRGPFVGLLAALAFLGITWAAHRGRRAMLAALGLLAAVAAFFVVFNLPHSPLAPLRQVPYLGRLGQVFELESGTGRVRVLIWRGAAELVTSDPLRLVTGYGPESMTVAYNRFYQPELANLESRNASPDRSHNETFDVLINTGLIGFALYLALFTSLFYYGLKWLGFIEGARQRNSFLAFVFGGGALAVAAFLAWQRDLAFFGVALPFGMVAGLFGYVMLRALRGWTPPNRPSAVLLAGLLAALLAHFVEINYGIAIAATRTVFFVLAGAFVVVGALGAERGLVGSGEAEPGAGATGPAPTTPAAKRKVAAAARRPDPRARPGRGRAWLSDALMMLTLLAPMVYSFVVTLQFRCSRQGLAMIWLFAFTWGLGSLALMAEAAVRARRDPGAPRVAVWAYVATTLGGLALYLLTHASLLAVALAPSGSGGPFAGGDASGTLLLLFGTTLVLLMTLWAWALVRDDPAPERTFRARAWWLYPIAAGLALVLAFVSNINVVRADIYYKQAYVNFHSTALQMTDDGRPDQAEEYFKLALPNYDRALALNPGEDYYLLFRGKALLERADAKAQALEPELARLAAALAPAEAERFSEYTVSDATVAERVTDRDAAYEAALEALRAALAAAPLNTDHTANMARAYKFWGDRTKDPQRRAERFDQSREFYRKAIAQSPANAGLREELATTEYLAGDLAAALAGISDTLKVDPQFKHPLRLRATIRREQGDLAGAEADYLAYVKSRDGSRDPLGWSGYAIVLGKQAKYAEAISANQKVLTLAPGDPATLTNLVILARDSGNLAQACQFLREGLEAQPESPQLASFNQELGCEAAPAPAATPAGAAP